jgi:hypothetical protein
MGAAHRLTSNDMHIGWTVEGHPEARLLRARGLQQEGGSMTCTPDN